MFNPRQYQDDIYNAVFEYLFEKEGNPIVASPGGTGKSHVMNRIIKTLVTKWPGTKVISLVHDAKVIGQNHASMLKFWPQAPAGIYSAGLKRKEAHFPITFAGIQSVAKKAADFGKLHIIIIDECDLVSPKEETFYQRFIADCKKENPALRVIGFTATPYRLGLGCLTNSELWDEICIDLTRTEKFNWFVEHGFLAPLVTKKPSAEIDVRNVSMRGGDFDEKEMQEAANTDELNEAVVSECIKYGSDRNHWLVFSSGVEHGHKLAKLFNARGIPAVMLSGKDTMAHREEMEAKFRSGECRVLVNCGLFGRGWDLPELDLIAVVRATQSVAWWVQACVRGTRIAPTKQDCLVLDFAGNIKRIGPVNDPIVPAPRRKGQEVAGEAPIKECPQCYSYLPIQVKICPDCGYAFPPPKTIKKTADTAEIMRRTGPVEQIIEEFKVLGVRYKPEVSKKGMKYLQVSYAIGTYNFREAKFFHSGGSREIELWWKHRGGRDPLPKSSEEAAERSGELRTPSLIRVDVSPQNKYPQVLGCEFSEAPEEAHDFEEPPF
jgi:DNA repair protein RadD